MRKTVLAVMAVVIFTNAAYAESFNNQPLTGSTGERATVAIAEMVNALIQISKGPAPIYQVPAIIVPRYGDQPFAGYFGANYVADYKDATNGLLVVKGNIQIILPNDGNSRTVEQKGNVIIITNVNTGLKMTVKVQ